VADGEIEARPLPHVPELLSLLQQEAGIRLRDNGYKLVKSTQLVEVLVAGNGFCLTKHFKLSPAFPSAQFLCTLVFSRGAYQSGAPK
jgi:hypothetical protein